MVLCRHPPIPYVAILCFGIANHQISYISGVLAVLQEAQQHWKHIIRVLQREMICKPWLLFASFGGVSCEVQLTSGLEERVQLLKLAGLATADTATHRNK